MAKANLGSLVASGRHAAKVVLFHRKSPTCVWAHYRLCNMGVHDVKRPNFSVIDD